MGCGQERQNVNITCDVIHPPKATCMFCHYVVYNFCRKSSKVVRGGSLSAGVCVWQLTVLDVITLLGSLSLMSNNAIAIAISARG